MIHQVHSMLQYNTNAIVKTIQIPNKDKVHTELQDKQPLIIMYPENTLTLSLETMNMRIPGYIIKDEDKLISLEQLIHSDTLHILDNQHIIDDYHLTEHHDAVAHIIKDYTSCDISYKLSLHRGAYQSRLYKNDRERLLLQSLCGPYIVYVFNPKHNHDIQGLSNHSIKKWGIKIDMNTDNIVSIPTEWSYFYETLGEIPSETELILSKIECDSIPTWLFNRLRRK
jgi:hypothetical protein